MEREGISTLSICGFPRALRGLLIFENCFRVCVKKFLFGNALVWRFSLCLILVSVLKNVNKANVLKLFLKSSFLCKCKSFEQTSNNYLLYYSKRVILFLFSFRQCYPTISE